MKTPSFTKEKPQPSKCEVDVTREIARVQIHVERVIGLLRQKFRILNARLPVNMVMCKAEDDISMMDLRVVIVCAALCNCC